MSSTTFCNTTEICIFSYLATEFKTEDACVVGSESYADFCEQLLTHSECEPLISEYCRQMGFPDNSNDFVEYLRRELTRVASEVDEISSDGKQLTISKDGEPVLKRLKSLPEPKEVEELEEKIRALIPERSILDILCNVEHWLNWNLIKTHWQDMMRVVLSIKAGKVMPSTLLRKLAVIVKKIAFIKRFKNWVKLCGRCFCWSISQAPNCVRKLRP